MCDFCKIGQTQRTAYIQGKAQLSSIWESGEKETGSSEKRGGNSGGVALLPPTRI